MEAGRLHDDQIKKSSSQLEEIKLSEEEEAEREGGEKAAEKTLNGEVVVDIKGGGNESPKAEKVCRICHLGKEDSSGGSELELILLGCDCRGELGVSHNGCAEAWFTLKGNRLCEICGKTAKNIMINNEKDTSIFMLELNEMRMIAATLDSSHESSRRCNKSFCNVLLGCFVVAFILPWFFHGTDIL